MDGGPCPPYGLFGNGMFGIFGITVDSFRIGAGALLFLSAVSLVRGRDYYEVHDEQEDIFAGAVNFMTR
jgi:multiple antibiotic resistance protein